MKHLLILAVATLLPSFAMAQDSEKSTLTMDAQIRTRGEYNNGAGQLRDEGAGPATFINDRVRLGIGWERANLSMKISAQHTGVWGDDALKNGTKNKKGEIGINEAWAKLKFGEGNKAFVQLGRQILSYDDERLLGGLDWATSGQSHDAVRVGYQSGSSTIHAIVAYNQDSEKKATGEYNNIYSGYAPYQHMEVLWYHLNASENFGGSFIFMNTGVQTVNKANNRYTANMQTTGIYLNGKASDLTWNGAFYYQFGEAEEDVKISAFMASLNAKYNVNDQWTVGLGDDYLSGYKDDDASDKVKTFNTLYGTHHKFYGAMDVMNGGTEYGLNDLNANIAYKTSSKVDMSAAYHYFAAPGLSEKKTLGSEVDLQLNWKIQKNVTFQCGYSMFFATDSGCALKGGYAGAWQDWGWVSLNINPQIFKTIF